MNKFHSRLAVGNLFFLHGLCFSTWGARIPAIQEKLALSESQLGSVLFSLPVGSLLSMPLAVWLVSRAGSRKVLITAILVYAMTLVTLGLASSVFALVGMLIVFGLAGNMVNVSLNTQAVGVEAIYQRSIMASLHGLWSTAGFTGAAIGSFMIGANVAPSLHFLFILGIAVIGLGIHYRFLLPDSAFTKGEDHPLFALPNRSLMSLGLIAFCCMICEGAMFDWSSIYFKKVVLAEKAAIGAGYTAFMSTMAGTRFFADRLKVRFGLQQMLRWSGLLVATGLAISAIFPHFLSSILGFLLVGIGVSAVVPMVFSEAGKTTTMPPSAAIAAVSTVGFMGFLIGPPLIGWVAGATNLRVSFSIIAVMGFCIALLSSKSKVK